MTNTVGERSIKKIMKALPGTKSNLIDKSKLDKRTVEMWLSRLTASNAIEYTLVNDARGRLQTKLYSKKTEDATKYLFMR